MLISIVVVLKGVREAIVARNGLPAYFSWAILLLTWPPSITLVNPPPPFFISQI